MGAVLLGRLWLCTSYPPVLLYQAGDAGRNTLSADAEALFSWLRTLEGGGAILCDYLP